MRKLNPGDKLVLATHNAGKYRENADLLAPYGLEVLSAGDLGLPEPEETGSTYSENAVLKAKAACEATGLAAIADDSGLDVPALGGKPGIHTARWAGPERDFKLAMEKVHRELGEATDRRGFFVCNLSVVWPDGETASFEGRMEGSLVWPPRGDIGFGFDPMFQPKGYDLTFAEMDPAKKHAISHRALAFAQLKKALLEAA
ncbi:RdgB/HAM1 family non-canonical purine NTP pyrophosphatase [Pelagibius litoralis]|uniref:dITP/XTP pyrophosphatase n=1 Tax=Pelagibius litoralis TaxID=374515 RepID=A0A967KEM0_9PROT|nr:RdgB/HAM1 family non-canonical purine NTP pyrophosphatase [Pelagibius litoralis]NIA71999.1 RdgB/HAM1 family non-canonical purine NTP pyrophosphatase [Pelagibius litoralis]